MLTAAVLCNFIWAGTGQYVLELFPTTLRNTAAGFTTLFDPLAIIMVEQLVYLETIFWRPILFVSVTVVSTSAFLISYAYLPETKGKAPPDSISEADQTQLSYHREQNSAKDGSNQG